MSRSFSSGARTVSRRWSASGWPGPNVRGTRPSGGAPRRPRRRARPSRSPTSTKLVTDGPTDQPSAAERVGQARRARSATRARLSSRHRRVAQRLGHDRDRHGRHRPGRSIRLERGDDLGAGDREPDPQAGQRVGLARGPDDDEVRVRRRGARPGWPRRTRRTPRRGRRSGVAAGRGGVARRARRGASRDRRRPARPARSGCSGCTARRPPRPRRRRGSRRGRSPSPRPSPQPRDRRRPGRRAARSGRGTSRRSGSGRRPAPPAGRKALATRSRISSAPAPTQDLVGSVTP